MPRAEGAKTKSVLKKHWLKVPKALLLLAILALVSLGVAAKVGHDAKYACTDFYRTDEVVQINGKTIFAQLASTDAEQEKGLSGHNCISSDRGMLFVFAR